MPRPGLAAQHASIGFALLEVKRRGETKVDEEEGEVEREGVERPGCCELEGCCESETEDQGGTCICVCVVS